jgi:hypothetical protein
MKDPKLADLEVDEKSTRQIHKKMARAKSVLIAAWKSGTWAHTGYVRLQDIL